MSPRPTRHTVLPALVGALALLASSSLAPDSAAVPAATPDAADRPNILLVNTDDMRADDARAMPKMLRWMRDGGTTYTNAYVPTPTCCPSRATLMSGRYVHNNGQRNQQRGSFWPTGTIQTWLNGAGYKTGVAGKFLNWWPVDTQAPGWDRWDVFRKGYRQETVNSNGLVTRSQEYTTDIVFDAAQADLDTWSAARQPWYLYLNPYAPHLPATPAPRYAETPVSARPRTAGHDEADRSDKPAWVRRSLTSYERATPLYQNRIRTLRSLDDRFDELMRRLQSDGALARTLVIFTSDNGFLLGEHGRSGKFLPYEESVNVPLLIRWPGRVPAGRTDGRLVGNVDLAPTILQAAGIAAEGKHLDGRSVWSAEPRRAALLEYFHDPTIDEVPAWAALKTKDFVYVEYFTTSNNTSNVTFREYYRMSTDPHQLRNLLGDEDLTNDPKTAALHTRLHALMSCAGAACRRADLG